jgi:serine/threonine-protein kinase HipA
MTSEAQIELFYCGAWRTVATVEIYPRQEHGGFNTPSNLSYDFDYVLELISDQSPNNMVGCRYPINFDNYINTHWPAFLLDMVPTGSARKHWLKSLSLKEDHASSWWPLLLAGAGSPPGNMRIKEAFSTTIEFSTHEGFSEDKIVEKNENFIEYVESCGAAVAGASDVQGESPKFLLVRDQHDRWHADGALSDGLVKDHWLVKFPRGKASTDKTVLRNEAPYYDVAQEFGVRTSQKQLIYKNNVLFIPRFDRKVTPQGVERFGLESLSSVLNFCEFGKKVSHNRACKMIMKYTTDPMTELREYILRDVLNVCLRNTDNHGRNTAFMKTLDGECTLSPLFDFAPMFMDSEGIPRAATWDNDAEKIKGLPDWGKVAIDLSTELNCDAAELSAWLTSLTARVIQLPATMEKCGVEIELIEGLTPRIKEVAQCLSNASPLPVKWSQL